MTGYEMKQQPFNPPRYEEPKVEEENKVSEISKPTTHKQVIALVRKLSKEGKPQIEIKEILEHLGIVSPRTGKPYSVPGICYLVNYAGRKGPASRYKPRKKKTSDAEEKVSRPPRKQKHFSYSDGHPTLNMIADILTAPSLNEETRCKVIKELAQGL